MNPLDDTLNVGATLPRQNPEGTASAPSDAPSTLGNTLNTGATLPRQSQKPATADQPPMDLSLDDLENQQTIKTPGSGTLVFNRYRLQRVLGRGGMGVVWLAVDTKLERAVALKFLPDIVGADPAALKELKDETRRGLELAHPNIVRIYDFVDDAEGAAISMEFVDGKSLSERRIAKPDRVFSVQDISAWVGQMCEALDYAHLQKRIVHRDLKPANLMLNSESEIKIADFGIARSVSDTMSRVSRTQQGTSGTLLYMSPQQAMGDRPRPTDDIYALGATLYELLTGKPPFYSGDITMQITTKTAPPLKQRREELEIKAHDEIPKEWEDAIAACLDKDPAKRPQTAGELARMLGLTPRCEAVLAPVKTKAGGLKSLEVTSQSAKEEQEKKSPVLMIVLASVAALLLLAGGGLGFAWWWANRPGEWVVQTDPPGAQITLDGRTLVAPAAVPGLKPGSYKASVALTDHEPKQLDFKVNPGQRVDLGVVKLERSTGSLLLSSDPDGMSYTVQSVDQPNPPKFTGATPDTIKLPVGRYSVSVKHKGEIMPSGDDIVIARNITSRKSFEYKEPAPPPAPAPVVAVTPPPAPIPAADTPPAGPQTPPSPGDSPPAPMAAPPATAGTTASAAPSAQTLAAANQMAAAGSAPVSPVINLTPAEPAPGPNMAAINAINAAQPSVGTPEGGYWKLDEILSNSEYSGYSESGRRYIVYRAQQELKLSADGAPGPGTYKAIVKFQDNNALQPTGQLDSATLAALGLGGLEDKSSWGSTAGRSSGSGRSSSSDRTPESEKTILRKAIEKNVLGGRDLRDIFRR